MQVSDRECYLADKSDFNSSCGSVCAFRWQTGICHFQSIFQHAEILLAIIRDGHNVDGHRREGDCSWLQVIDRKLQWSVQCILIDDEYCCGGFVLVIAGIHRHALRHP